MKNKIKMPVVGKSDFLRKIWRMVKQSLNLQKSEEVQIKKNIIAENNREKLDTGIKNLQNHFHKASLDICAKGLATDPVDEALKKLKEELYDLVDLHGKWILSPKYDGPQVIDCLRLFKNSQNLVFALEAEKRARIDIQKPSANQESIWKNVSELPDKSPSQIYIKYNHKVVEFLRGTIEFVDEGYNFAYVDWGAIRKDSIKEWCTVSDFINQHERMQADIETIKERLK